MKIHTNFSAEFIPLKTHYSGHKLFESDVVFLFAR